MTSIGCGTTVRLHCCECGGSFIIKDYSSDCSLGMEDIICPHCGTRSHRVKSCRGDSK